MTMLPKIALLACLLLPAPVLAQDFLGPLEDFVETLTKPQTPRTNPQRPPADGVNRPAAVTPPPIPRPRPPSLPDAPTVAAPTVAAPVAPTSEEEPTAPSTDAVEPAPEAVTPAAQPKPEPAPEPEPVVEPEPDRVYQVACPAVIMGLVEAEMTPPLSEGICGEQSPLTVTAVLSRGRMLPLSSPIVTNCQLASALPKWVETVDGYVETMLESPLASVDTGTSYMCRARNGGDTDFTSEHGFANAVDVTGFTLEDGRSIAVAADWDKAVAPEGRLLRLAHDAACGSFMTVLGPEANAEHEDHLHLDLGCHGESCTARICE